MIKKVTLLKNKQTYYQSSNKKLRLPKSIILASFLLIFLTAFTCSRTPSTSSTSSKDPVIATLGEKPVYVSEFEYSYEKSLQKDDKAYTQTSLEDYLDKYVNFKLKIIDAENDGIHERDAFQKELASYEDQLAQPYLIDRA